MTKTTVNAEDISSFEDLTSALENGLNVHFYQNYGECIFEDGSISAPNASSGGEITSFTINRDDESIKYTAYKLIFNYQSKEGGYVYDYGETVIHKNGTVFITATDLIAPDPNSGEPFYTEIFTCKFGSSINFFHLIQRKVNKLMYTMIS